MLSLRRKRDALREAEKVTWIIGDFDLLEAREIDAVIGLLPVSKVGVDVVLIRGAAGIRTHRLPCAVQPGAIGGDDCATIADAPGRVVLCREKGVAVRERRCVRGYAVDCAAILHRA